MKNRVLLVDDETDILYVLSEFLEMFDQQVYQASSGKQALDLCAKETLDIVITDYEMPDINGFDLAKKLIAIQPELKIYLLSGYAKVLSEDVLKGTGIIKVLDKPFKIEEIQEIFGE